MKHVPRVLIVDDEPDVLLLLRIELEAEGYETLLAADGETAVRRILEEKPDVVLLDVMMPVVDGWGVWQRLADHRSEARVIVLSAKASASDIAHALELGAHEYVPTPFDPAALLATVAHVLTSSAHDLEAGRVRRLQQLSSAHSR
jgi:DNA-binding response OmpR family regulator